MPVISVIVPVYKVEPYLRRCVDSILDQTFTDFELILVDDGSPDNCPAICDGYARQDVRVRVIHQENGGLSAARNAGIDWVFANSDSEWISFIDSDDWVDRRYLEALYSAVQQTGAKISMCRAVCTSGESEEVGEVLPAQLVDTETAYWTEKFSMTAWAKLYPKEIFREIRYPMGRLHEDEFVTYRVLFQFEEVAVLENALYCYFQNENGIMHTPVTLGRFIDLRDAFKNQIEYFNKKQKNISKRNAIRRYSSIIAQYHWGPPSECSDKKYDSFFRMEMGKLLLKWGKAADLTIQNSAWLYEFAWPHGMMVYWYWVALKRKILRLLNGKRDA